MQISSSACCSIECRSAAVRVAPSNADQQQCVLLSRMQIKQQCVLLYRMQIKQQCVLLYRMQIKSNACCSIERRPAAVLLS
jgi:hypothetical protein